METDALLPGSVNNDEAICYTTTTTTSEPVHTYKRYKRRWYILFLFTLLPATQNIIWGTWGPLTSSAEFAFGWDKGVIAFLANWGPITFILSSFFFSWLMDVKGLRLSCVVSAGLVCAGAGLRCITAEPPAVTWLVHVGQMLNGFAGPVAMAAPPLLSARWFPAEQRTTSTAFTALISSLGGLSPSLITPMLVKDFSNSGNGNSSTNSTALLSLPNNGSQPDPRLIHMQKQEIMKLMYIEFGWTAVLFFAVLLYFPAKPPTPPSVTADMDRVDFKGGLLRLIRMKQFWLLCIPYSLGCGVYYCWLGVLNINLKPLGIDQDVADKMIFYSGLPGVLSSIVVGRFADVFARHMKAMLIIVHVLACGALLWIAFCYLRILPTNLPSLYAILIIAGVSFFSAGPLLFELTCETTYPVGEGVTTGFIAWSANLTGFIFLLVLMIPNIGTMWMNWAFLGCVAVSVISLSIYKGQYNRLDLDKSST